MLFLPLNSCLEKLPEKEVSMMMDVPTDLVGLVKGKKSRNLIDLDQRFRVFSFFPSNATTDGCMKLCIIGRNNYAAARSIQRYLHGRTSATDLATINTFLTTPGQEGYREREFDHVDRRRGPSSYHSSRNNNGGFQRRRRSSSRVTYRRETRRRRYDNSREGDGRGRGGGGRMRQKRDRSDDSGDSKPHRRDRVRSRSRM
mmetsp:Transcript_24709/g.39681  ORF Transcript_24709/g.39681 Transcript_24709/m.39681 type:complete len:200 (-) Transcript_24709:200-799(-)